MADAVYNSEEIKLQDDRNVTLRPLPVGRLRRFMKAWEKFAEVKDEDQVFDIYINCCGISLEKEVADKFEETKDADKTITDEYREYLEDVLDMETIYKILDVCGGLKLNDPKLLEEAQRLAQESQAAGKN